MADIPGLNEVDALRAKHEAREQASHALAQSQEFGNMSYNREPYQAAERGLAIVEAVDTVTSALASITVKGIRTAGTKAKGRGTAGHLRVGMAVSRSGAVAEAEGASMARTKGTGRTRAWGKGMAEEVTHMGGTKGRDRGTGNPLKADTRDQEGRDTAEDMGISREAGDTAVRIRATGAGSSTGKDRGSMGVSRENGSGDTTDTIMKSVARAGRTAVDSGVIHDRMSLVTARGMRSCDACIHACTR